MTYSELYLSIKEKFKEVTNGKSNARMYGSKYFIPIEQVFTKRLSQAILEYDLDDLDKVQKVLYQHIIRANKVNFSNYTRTMEYFIYGQNGKDSQLATEYENIESDIIDSNQQIKFKSNIK